MTIKARIKQTLPYFIPGLLIAILYFLLRLVNLTILPIFVDEAVYIRWAQVMSAEPSLRFLPLQVGSPPLFIWLMMPFLKISADPLFAGRLVSVCSGFLSLIGVFGVSYLLFKKIKLSFFSAFLYGILPFMVFSERLALIDTTMTMFGIWLAFLAIILSRYQRLDLSMIMGFLFGGALLTKSPSVSYVLSLPFLTLLNFPFSKDKKTKLVYISKLVGLLLVVLFIGYFIYNFLLRLGPNFHQIALRNQEGVFRFSEIMVNPLNPLWPHLKDLADWLPNLLTLPVVGLVVFGIIFCLKYEVKKALYLLAWSLFPLIFVSLISKVFTPRYVLFTIWPYVIFAGFGMEYFNKIIRNKFGSWVVILFILIILLPALNYDYKLLTNPERTPLPRNLRYGHLEEWTAGQGIKEISIYLKERSQSKKILVGTEGSFGTLPDGLQMYLQNVPNITVIGIGLNPDKVPQPLLNSLIDHDEVYLVINDERLSFNPENQKVTVIYKYPKATRPNGTFQSLLFLKINR